jgi:cardiolipin synthase A/B
LVAEAVKLFVADMTRQHYTPGFGAFVVSPVNARKQISAFIKGAKKQLLIYDPEISDPAMLRLLEERAKAGAEIKIIGKVTRRSASLMAHKLAQMRLHTRSMVRDFCDVFVGSQSLRPLELDARREIGVIFRNQKIAGRLIKVFREDWGQKELPAQAVKEAVPPAAKVAKKVARVVIKELPPVAPVVETTVKEVVGDGVNVDFDPEELEEQVKDAVKEAVKQVVKDAVEEIAVGDAPSAKAS